MTIRSRWIGSVLKLAKTELLEMKACRDSQTVAAIAVGILSSAIGFLPHSHSLKLSFSNSHMKCLFYYLSLSPLSFQTHTSREQDKATAIFEGTNGQGTI